MRTPGSSAPLALLSVLSGCFLRPPAFIMTVTRRSVPVLSLWHVLRHSFLVQYLLEHGESPSGKLTCQTTLQNQQHMGTSKPVQQVMVPSPPIPTKKFLRSSSAVLLRTQGIVLYHQVLCQPQPHFLRLRKVRAMALSGRVLRTCVLALHLSQVIPSEKRVVVHIDSKVIVLDLQTLRPTVENKTIKVGLLLVARAHVLLWWGSATSSRHVHPHPAPAVPPPLSGVIRGPVFSPALCRALRSYEKMPGRRTVPAVLSASSSAEVFTR